MRLFKTRLVKVAVCLFASLTTLIVVTTTAQMQNDEIVAQAYRTVNVRSGPSTQYDIIGQLNSGDEVRITGRSDEESNWLRIDFGEKEGWVAYFTVTVIGPVDNLPVVEALADRSGAPTQISATPMVERGNTFVSVFRRVNVRSGPGMEYRRLGILEPGSSADVKGRTEDDEWLEITYNGQLGWVAYFVVSVTGDLDSVDVASVPLTAATRTPPEIELTTRYNVNLRMEPIIGTPIIAVVPYNTTLVTDARADSNGLWLRVTYEGEQGWLLSSLVSIDGSIDTLPVVQPLAKKSAN